MTPAWAWPLSILFAAGWALAAILGIGHVVRHIRSQALPPPAPKAAAPSRPGHAVPPQRDPGTQPTTPERDRLAQLAHYRLAATPKAIENSRLIADGLRLRFGELDDEVLGLVALYLTGWAADVLAATRDPVTTLGVFLDACSFAAEELARPIWQEARK